MLSFPLASLSLVVLQTMKLIAVVSSGAYPFTDTCLVTELNIAINISPLFYYAICALLTFGNFPYMAKLGG